jgi:hypothetical protein
MWFGNWFGKCLRKIHPTLEHLIQDDDKFQVDEPIDNYFKCLDDHDRSWSIAEEFNNQKVFG